jgi:hypothetical protein
MRKRVVALTASAVVLAFGVVGPIAQAQSPATSGATSQQNPIGSNDSAGMTGRGGMMGGGMRGHRMMSGGMMGQGGSGGMAPLMMRMMFSLMDADGDGKLSLQEFQAAHERIFKTMDANKDGFVSFEEMQKFIRGTVVSTSQQ